MKKKLIVIVIAVVLVASIVGTCFALYTKNATQKSFSISAGNQVVTLTINNGDNTGAQASFNFDALSPDNLSESQDIALHCTNTAYVDGVHGKLTIAQSGDLADSVDVTVQLLTAADGTVDSDISTAALGSGQDFALSALPKFVRITVTLKAAAASNFAAIAEDSLTLTINWEIVSGSVFSYDNNAHYVVGRINGVEAWYPCSSSILMQAPQSGTDIKVATGVTLKAGDEFKVVWNYDGSYNSEEAQWYGGDGQNTDDIFSTEGSNVQIKTDGTYTIYLNSNYRVYLVKE